MGTEKDDVLRVVQSVTEVNVELGSYVASVLCPSYKVILISSLSTKQSGYNCKGFVLGICYQNKFCGVPTVM